MNNFQKALNKQLNKVNKEDKNCGGYWDISKSYRAKRIMAKKYLKAGIKLGGNVDKYCIKSNDSCTEIDNSLEMFNENAMPHRRKYKFIENI